MTNTKIPKLILDPHTGNSLLLLGSSRSGKTYMLMKLYDRYFNNKKFISTLFAANPQIDAYKGYEKYLLTATGFEANHEAYIRSQQYVNKNTENKYDFLCCFDDQVDIRHSRLLKNLLLSYRNSNISSMICLQGVKLLTPDCRGNVHNVVFHRFNNEESIDQVVNIFLKDYFQRLGWHKTTFAERYRDLTSDYHVLYLHVLTEYLWSSRYGDLIVDGVVV
jgi:hypothetical protein